MQKKTVTIKKVELLESPEPKLAFRILYTANEEQKLMLAETTSTHHEETLSNIVNALKDREKKSMPEDEGPLQGYHIIHITNEEAFQEQTKKLLQNNTPGKIILE